MKNISRNRSILIGGIFIAIFAFFLTLGTVVAAPDNLVIHTLNAGGVSKSLVLPNASDHSPVISLGSAVDLSTGKTVEGYAIVHYMDGYAKGGNKGGKPSNGSKTSSNSCYAFMASGAKWKVIEPWTVNPSNNRGLDGAFILNNLSSNVAKWENTAGVNILGDGSATFNSLVADTASPDGVNEVYFGSISDPGVIGVTIVWGIFSGPPFARELVEWDMVFNETDYDWSQVGEAGKMDFENIATHELGHAVGLADLYDSACGEETMYGYSDFGETKKRDLNAGDIAGVNKLY